MSKHTAGKDAEANTPLVPRLIHKRDELRKADPPVGITGLQLIYLVREFFRVHDTQETAFEFPALMSLEYTGEGHLLLLRSLP